MPWVGSWFSQNTWSNWSYEILVGSNTTRTTSLWPVPPVHTSRYVGFGVYPAAYPTDVLYTPGSFQNAFSAPQKHPMPNSASSVPAGKGGSSREPSTKCSAGTVILSGRPGSASSGRGRVDFFISNEKLMPSILVLGVPSSKGSG